MVKSSSAVGDPHIAEKVVDIGSILDVDEINKIYRELSLY